MAGSDRLLRLLHAPRRLSTLVTAAERPQNPPCSVRFNSEKDQELIGGFNSLTNKRPVISTAVGRPVEGTRVSLNSTPIHQPAYRRRARGR